jgi:hypothetical protein
VSQFNQLLNKKAEPVFYAFDLIWMNGSDLRQRPLVERKEQLRDLVRKNRCERLLYAQHIDAGKQFFAEICALVLASRQRCGALLAGLRGCAFQQSLELRFGAAAYSGNESAQAREEGGFPVTFEDLTQIARDEASPTEIPRPALRLPEGNSILSSREQNRTTSTRQPPAYRLTP